MERNSLEPIWFNCGLRCLCCLGVVVDDLLPPERGVPSGDFSAGGEVSGLRAVNFLRGLVLISSAGFFFVFA